MDIVTELQKAERLEQAAREYANTLRLRVMRLEAGASIHDAKDRSFAYASDVADFVLCNAAIDLADDGNFLHRRSQIEEQNRWDCEGFPVNEDWHRIPDASQFSIPHHI